jgi:hypothetical protein
MVQELLRALIARGIDTPRVIGIQHQLPGYDGETERHELTAFLG